MKANIFMVKITLILLVIISASYLYADCKLMGLIGLNGKSLTQTYCSPDVWTDFTYPCLLKLKSQGSDVSYYPNNNPNGWGLAAYCQDTPSLTMLWRNNQEWLENTHMAINSEGYNEYVSLVSEMNPRIILGHVRNATNPETSSLPDPHPFYFNLFGKDYSFIHNGALYDDIGNPQTSVVLDLYNNHIGTEWLTNHGLDPQQYGGKYIDSEIYFYWIIKCIEAQNGDILSGLKIALLELTDDANSSALNFILTDGIDMYAYKYSFNSSDATHPLAYFYDMDDTGKNYYYCGVMSIFPNGEHINTVTLPDWTDGQDVPNNVQVHKIENSELVYISSTGNIVRLPKFAHYATSLTNYWQKRDYHEGHNWEGFPILPIDLSTQTAPVSPYFDYFIAPEHGGIQGIVTQNDYQVNVQDLGWTDPTYEMRMSKLYKMHFDSDSPSIHNTTFSSNNFEYSHIKNARLYPADSFVLENVVADQEYWISYTLLPTQRISDAFGDSWNNVKSVKAEKWYYEQQIASSKDAPVEDPSYMYTTEGKNMEFGQGYIVRFNNNQVSFTWNRAYLPELPSPEPRKPEFFEWEDGPEYMVIDIYGAENEQIILEVGGFQGENCIGAVCPDKFPCQLLIYPNWDDPNPITFQILYKAKNTPHVCNNYQVYQPELSGYFNDTITPEQNTNYIVKLGGSAGDVSQNTPSLVSVSNYPNPFNPNTNISFALNQKSNVEVTIYNVKGQLVKDFGTLPYNSGIHHLNWNGDNNLNNPVAGGIYFVRVSAGTNVLTHKIVMLK